MGFGPDKVLETEVGKQAWPKSLPEQASPGSQTLGTINRPVEAADIAKAFKGARQDRVAEILAALTSLCPLIEFDGGRYAC